MKKEIPKSFDLAFRARYHQLQLARGGRTGRTQEGCLTYRDLLRTLRDLRDSQLDQKVQLFKDSGNLGEPVCLMPAYGFGTVEEMCHVEGEVARQTRGPDFSHHPEQLILLIDGAPFSPEGDEWYTLEDGGMRGNVTGKLLPHGGRRAVREPVSWAPYGRLLYVDWRLKAAVRRPSWDEASGEWAELGPEQQAAWASVAKQAALAGYAALTE